MHSTAMGWVRDARASAGWRFDRQLAQLACRLASVPIRSGPKRKVAVGTHCLRCAHTFLSPLGRALVGGSAGFVRRTLVRFEAIEATPFAPPFRWQRLTAEDTAAATIRTWPTGIWSGSPKVAAGHTAPMPSR
jgi:hypothetical protein